VALEHIELSSAFDYGGLAVLRDAWERFAMVVGSRKLSNLCGSNTARVGEGRVGQGNRCTAVSFEIGTCVWPLISVESITTRSAGARCGAAPTQLRIERHNRMRSTSLSVISSFVRS
jgi:hypothetical protein